MSELNEALKRFEFMSMNDVTPSSLKTAFKSKVLQSHPDKGGNADDFDNMLQSFMYLSETLERICGGRAKLQNIMSPEELKGMLANITVSKVIDEFINDEFNKQFEKIHKVTGHGYADWIKSKTEDANLINGKYGEATIKEPTFKFTELNTVFEEVIKKDKPEPSSIILHPDAMAYISGTVLGTEIIENQGGTYTAEMFTNPEYTDLYSAFTSDNTICDKVTSFTDKAKSIDELINERNEIIAPFDDTELKAIQEFEKNKLEKDKQHLTNIKNYFSADNNSNSHYINDSSQSGGFIHTF